MNRYLFIICFLFSLSVSSQKKPVKSLATTAKIVSAEVTLNQFEFLNNVKLKYPDFVVLKKIDNLYVNGKLLQSSYKLKDESGSYEVILNPDNKGLRYDMTLINIGRTYGDIILYFDGVYVKTEAKESTSEFNVYFDGKKEF